MLISVLLRELDKANIYLKGREFEAIAAEWLSEKEVSRELKDAYGWDTEGNVTVGWSFWKFFGVEGKMRGVYSQENQTTQTIRKKVKSNQRQLVEKLNVALAEVRDALKYHNRGKDLVIIVDGLEKAHPKVYETIFLEDTAMIEGLGLHLISCVPIKTFYDIQHRSALDIYKLFYLPMVRVSDQNKGVFESLLTKRVAPELFEAGIIDQFVDYSGGCPRQLLKIVNLSLQKSLGNPIEVSIAEEAIKEMGNERFRALTAQHKELLRAGAFDDADKELLELLFSLNLLEYNGTDPERKINPLIQRFFLDGNDV